MFASFDRFELQMTKAQAAGASHQGQCGPDVKALSAHPKIAKQLRELDSDTLREELREYGAWSDDELQDRAQNEQRILWLAAGQINDEAAA